MITRIGYIEEDKRWKVTISYAVTETETRQVIHHIWELDELQQLIENGPTFCAIRSFNIEYMGPKETIEQAANQ